VTPVMLQQVDNSESSPEDSSSVAGEIYVKNAYKSFDVTKALDDCSFSANFGEIHAIVGGNGCGKSTLAKVLSGVLPLDSGKLSIRGHHPSSPSEARKLGIATVFQEVMVADEASILDNLYVGADGFWTKKRSPAEKLATATTLMEELTAEKLDLLAPAGDLPLSLKAWITIARALLCDPEVLILDESSAALDFDSTERLFNKMRELRDRGVAIIIVTHRIAELIRISDRATIMRDGKDVGVLAKSEITEKNLLSLMTGKTDVAQTSSADAHKNNSQEVTLALRNLKVWPSSLAFDFDLMRGEIVGVTGLDGHGQDDFARILAGVEQPADGSVFVATGKNGNRVAVRSLKDAKQHGISFVSGDRKREGILPNMSIFENLLLPLYKSNVKIPIVRFIDWTSLTDVFDWEVERLAIKTGPKSNPITSLSGGNQQKLIIGRSFALHPRILILNDPARGIDIDTKRELYRHLREYAAEGNSVVYMSSELEEFIGFCSKVVVFRNGTVFKNFIDAEVEPSGLLEGMFGRVNGGTIQSEKAVEQDASSDSQQRIDSQHDADQHGPISDGVSQSPLRTGKVTGSDVRRIRIVEFDDADKSTMPDSRQPAIDEKSSQSSNTPPIAEKPASEKIKISFFD